MVEGLTIREALTADAAELAALAYLSWETGILPLLAERPGMRDAERRRLLNYASESIPRIIVAIHQGDVIGWCSQARGRPYIPYLFVATYMQGGGVGTSLLRRMESLLELQGFDRVSLETPADHVRAVKFYQHQGYRILAMRPEGRGVQEPLVSVRLEKRLNPYKGPIPDVDL